jgi:2-desacetyl-2-hydroxyethyl bacteriochlorophyllide A dehydrogenase
MKAVVLESPKVFRISDVPEPTAPSSTEALVRIHRIGICGTDYAGYLGKMPYFSYPRIPGHELGVEVVALGDQVQNVRVGDRCAVEPYINCQTCYSCRRGLTNCCEAHKTLGVMCDGGMTELMLLPARKLHPANNLTFEQMALVETLAIGCHAVNRANVQPQENVLVIGAGPIGLSAVEFCRIAGARTIVVDVEASRLDFVRDRIGIPDVIKLAPEATNDAVEALSQLTNGQLADVVIDATGNNLSMASALEYCAYGARLVYVGITQNAISLPHTPILHRREVTIMASRNALSGDFSRIISLIEQGRIDTVPWITHHTNFENLIATFPSFLLPENRVIKAIVSVN